MSLHGITIEAALSAGSFCLLFFYHIHLLYRIRRAPEETVFTRNSQTRAQWVKTVMEGGRDILAVQTLRNWTMAASFLASTAILIGLAILNMVLVGHGSSEALHLLNFLGSKSEKVRLLKFVVLSADFLFAFFNFTLAIRFYNHVGFMINVPPARGSEELEVVKTVNHGAYHYTLGMRGYYLAIPLTLWLIGPAWLFGGTLLLVWLLYRIDRTG